MFERHNLSQISYQLNCNMINNKINYDEKFTMMNQYNQSILYTRELIIKYLPISR